MNLLMSRLAPAQRRLYCATEVESIGKGGTKILSEITGLSGPTIRRGREELAALLAGRPLEGPKGHPGRPWIETKYPEIEEVLERMLSDDTAGDPMSRRKWARISSRRISKKLAEQGYSVGYHTVCRLLKQMGYSLKVNVKARASTAHSPKRDMQFRYISTQKAAFLASGNPVISVDAKKKELIGNFKANGQSWCKEAVEVDDHTYASLADCVAAPYGVYDVGTNKGYVWVGTSGDTPAFAVEAIRRWWLHAGRHVYAEKREILVLADGGGSNGCRSRAWKHEMKTRLCDAFGLAVTVCHYPPRCSKFNPIERRLFSQISMNWTGRPLTSLNVMLGYIRGTSTATGMAVEAFLMDDIFPQGQKVSKETMNRLAIKRHSTFPDWNYTILPEVN